MTSTGGLHFYPRSPCGERPVAPVFDALSKEISIHALLAESDHHQKWHHYQIQPISIHALLAESDIYCKQLCINHLYFYPRSPCGERRNAAGHGPDGRLFLSTLSLRRATLLLTRFRALAGHFYPRSPCGERLLLIGFLISNSVFLSTLSLRRATQVTVNLWSSAFISIHALLAESDHFLKP